MYRDTVSVFTRKCVRNADVWYCTVIANADFNADRGAIIAKYGDNSADNAKVHIKYADGEIIADKQYVTPKVYQGLADCANHITFQPGDIVMLGEWTGDAVIEDSSFHSGFYELLNKTYDNVYRITSVAKYSVIPHFEVLAK